MNPDEYPMSPIDALVMLAYVALDEADLYVAKIN